LPAPELGNAVEMRFVRSFRVCVKLFEKPKNHHKTFAGEFSMTTQKSLAEPLGPISNCAHARKIELTKKLWDSETHKYNEKNKTTFPRVLAIADEIRKTKFGNKVLDIGCGLGILYKILGEEYQYYGCDISHEVVQMHNSPNIVECDLDYDQLPFKDVRFNYIVCSGVIDYLADVRKFLLDINRYYGHENCLFLITEVLRF
jgi:2-polyprenyl-3-methyl-5-hydroxy-6-metoxy-1,4-benzoquinol methylase